VMKESWSQKILLRQPNQPLPGILDFGLARVGIFLRELNLTSHLFEIYHSQRSGEATSVP
jgi:hypothetical protein